MKQFQKKLSFRSKGRGLFEITSQVQSALVEAEIHTGLCVVYCCHTSASLIIQENADPTVQEDLMAWLAKVAPDGDPNYLHDTEGPDDMAAHIRTMISRTSETIPVVDGRLALGTWQGIYLAEHRTAPHTRTVIIHITGE